MKALIVKKVMLTVEPGSIVEISESQFKTLRDKAVAYKEEAKEEPEVVEQPKASSKKTSKKKKSED